MIRQRVLSLLFLIIVFACQPKTELPEDVKNLLIKFSSNRAELEEVLDHYRNDSLKQQAAIFLIRNMVGKYHYESDTIDIYQNALNTIPDSIFQLPDQRFVHRVVKDKWDSLERYHGTFTLQNLKHVQDIEAIRAEVLIKNIDHAITQWQTQPYARHLTFDEFCEYILPIKNLEERPIFWRNEFQNQYASLQDSLSHTKDAVAATNMVNKILCSEYQLNLMLFTDFNDFISTDVRHLKKFRKGSNCWDFANLTCHAMRSLGIPAALVYSPHWVNRGPAMHAWNVTLNKDHKMVLYQGTLHESGSVKLFEDRKVAKMFHKTFGRQTSSLACQVKIPETIPANFRDPYFTDVTNHFISTSNVQLTLDTIAGKKFQYAYLCTFNNKNWIPLWWGSVKGNQAVFKNMGNDGIAYMAAYYNEGKIIPASKPFILMPDGEVKFATPDRSKTQHMHLTRKYYLAKRISEFAQSIENDLIEGANQPDFKDAKVLHRFKTYGLMWNDVNFPAHTKYQYYRYKSNDTLPCGIAELQFFNSVKQIKNGKPIGTMADTANVFDSKFITFASHNSSGWVGMDFGTPVHISRIRVMPRSDVNFIIPGDVYELFYWNNGWQSVGKQTANDFHITFKEVPSNALYLLHNHSGGKEERIFTYENGKQLWW